MWLKAASARYEWSCNIKYHFCRAVVRVVAIIRWSDAQHTDDAQLVFKFHREVNVQSLLSAGNGFLAPRILRAIFECC